MTHVEHRAPPGRLPARSHSPAILKFQSTRQLDKTSRIYSQDFELNDFTMSPLFHTQTKDSVMFIAITSEEWPLHKVPCQVLEIRQSGSDVEQPFFNLNYRGNIRQYSSRCFVSCSEMIFAIILLKTKKLEGSQLTHICLFFSFFCVLFMGMTLDSFH